MGIKELLQSSCCEGEAMIQELALFAEVLAHLRDKA